MQDEKILFSISKELEINTGENISKQALVAKINDLITSDFQKLVSVLYRMDVSEAKLKQLLKENRDVEAAVIIVDLMIERQIQKNKSRQEYKRDDTISDDERW